MKNGWHKLLVIAVALATFGAISPNHVIWEHLLEDKGQAKAESENFTEAYEAVWTDPSEYWITDELVLENLYQSAEQQAHIKFGSRIGPVIGPDFDRQIFPKMQEVIQEQLTFLDSESLKRLAVSENPSGNYSEKIFHIFDEETGDDVIRFHVRTEKRPLEGYSFNFHYHTAEDGFQTHYTVGDIFWSKNTPPKWLS
nr:YpjP family protein [Indiicoccus explosivorum]